MKTTTTIHLWSAGMEKYIGNIMLTRELLYITEDELKEIVNTHPDKDKVKYVTFETEERIEL